MPNKEEVIAKKKMILQKKKDAEKKKQEAELAIKRDLIENALGIYAKYSFYKDGYLKSLGTMILILLTSMVLTSGLIYSKFYYKSENVFLPINALNQLSEPMSLSQPKLTDNEIRKFATEAYVEISNYNYVTVDNYYFSDISKLFTPKSYKEYRDNFKKSDEIKVVKKNEFVVHSIIVKEATIDEEKSKELRKQSPNYLWVVNIKGKRVYQARKSFVYDDYETRMIITRSPTRLNEKGVAIHSIVNKKIEKNIRGQ